MSTRQSDDRRAVERDRRATDRARTTERKQERTAARFAKAGAR